MIPLGPPHFPAWHLRSAALSSSVVWIFDRIVSKSAVSSGVGSVLRLIVLASFGASLIWVSVTIISLRSSWIQVFVSVVRSKGARVGWSSSMIFFGISISYNCLSLVSVERISALLAVGDSLRLLIVSFKFTVAVSRLHST